MKAAWALFIVLGIPLGLLAILGPLAYAGYYFEPLRQFWRPWPPEYLKAIIGIGGFAAVAAHLCYRNRVIKYRGRKAVLGSRNLATHEFPKRQPELPFGVNPLKVNQVPRHRLHDLAADP